METWFLKKKIVFKILGQTDPKWPKSWPPCMLRFILGTFSQKLHLKTTFSSGVPGPKRGQNESYSDFSQKVIPPYHMGPHFVVLVYYSINISFQFWVLCVFVILRLYRRKIHRYTMVLVCYQVWVYDKVQGTRTSFRDKFLRKWPRSYRSSKTFS